MWTFVAAYIISVKYSVTNGFSARVICIKPQMKSTIALTLCYAQSPSSKHIPGFFVYHAQSEDLLQGQRVIVHIMSRTVVSIHTSCPHMVYMAMLNIHAPMKYTWLYTKPTAEAGMIRNLVPKTYLLLNHNLWLSSSFSPIFRHETHISWTICFFILIQTHFLLRKKCSVFHRFFLAIKVTICRNWFK